MHGRASAVTKAAEAQVRAQSELVDAIPEFPARFACGLVISRMYAPSLMHEENQRDISLAQQSRCARYSFAPRPYGYLPYCE